MLSYVVPTIGGFNAVQPLNAVGSIVTDGDVLILIKETQFRNALARIDVDAGILTFLSLEHPLNKKGLINASFGKEADIICRHCLNAPSFTDVASGKEISDNKVFANASSPIDVTLGIVIVDSLVHA